MSAAVVAGSDAEAVYDVACDRGGLTRRQLLIWAGDRLADGAPVFVEAASFRFRGPLDPDRYVRVFAAVVAESDAMRTRIEEVDGWPRRVDDPAAVPAIDVVDLTRRGSALGGLDDLARDLVWSCARVSGPLVASRLVRLGSEDHVFLLAQHQLVSDSWSFGVMHERMLAHYRAHSVGADSPVAPPQFGEYVEYERAFRASPRAGDARAYWRQAYADTPRRIELGGGGPHATRVHRLVRHLGPTRSQALRRRAGESPSLDVGMFAVFASVMAAHLHRTTGRRELLLNLPFANRPSARFKQTLGTFMNVCPIRIEISGEDTFETLRERITLALWEAARHQGYAGRASGVPQPYDVLVNVHRAALAGDLFDTCGMQVDWIAPTHRYGAVLLAVHDFGATGDVALVLDLNEESFEGASRTALVEALMRWLDAALTDPTRSLDAVDRRARSDSSPEGGMAATHDEGATVWPRIAVQAAKTPAAMAVRVDGATVTYGALVTGAVQVAMQLAAVGVSRDAIVAVWGRRGRAWLQAMLGLWVRGAVYLPLDPRWPAPRIQEVMRRSGARLVLTDRNGPPIPAALEGHPEWRIVPLDADVQAPVATVGRAEGVLGRDLAYVIYTSGSTGAPKGALIEHAGLRNHLDAKIALLGLGPDDRVAQTAAAGFDISLWQCLAPLLVGATVEILDDASVRDPVALQVAVRDRRLTILEVVPAVLQTLLDADEAAARARRDLASLRWLVVTGEALPPELCRRWLARYPAIPLVNAYGPTECADDVMHHVVRIPPAVDVLRMPIGNPIQGMRVYVLDERLQPVTAGTAGEICVGGIGVGRGYLHDPERTAAAFVMPDPFSGTEGARLYRTGDRGRRRADGTLEWLGRLDAQVKIRGMRVEPAEVEAVLGTHPGVAEVAVVARVGAHGQLLLVAFVALTSCGEGWSTDTVATADRLRDLRVFASERLPAAMVPATVTVIDRLPRTPNGKVDYGALPEHATTAVRDGTPPDSFLEREVASIWTRLLGIEGVGRDDEFFALGGDSLLAHRMLLEIRTTFGVEVGVDTFLPRPTVAGVAASIAARQLDGLAAGEVDALIDEVEALSDADALAAMRNSRSSVIDDA